LELGSPLGGQAIKLSLAAGFRFSPFGSQKIPVLHPMQRRVQGALLYLQNVMGDLLDSLRDRVAMYRSEGNDLQNQHVKSSLWEIGFW
jgi:hypothetical protein